MNTVFPFHVVARFLIFQCSLRHSERIDTVSRRSLSFSLRTGAAVARTNTKRLLCSCYNTAGRTRVRQ